MAVKTKAKSGAAASNSTLSNVNGAQALVAGLKTQGVDTIFGLPGLQLDFVYDALYDERDNMAIFHTRHEQATAYMAFGYAQTSGKVGTCMVVPGPGVLNTTGALSTAYACNSPVLCITGQIPGPYIGGGLGFLHEIPNQELAMASVSKWQGRINLPGEAPAVIAEAFRQATSGRKRPVFVDIPIDVCSMKTPKVALSPQAVPDMEPEPDPGAVAKAAKLLAEAKYPAIIVGGGVFGAEAELLELARMLQAPVIMTEHALGAVDCRDPIAQTLQVGNDIWSKVDVVLGVGTRLFHQIVSWGRDISIKLVRIDIDPAQSVGHWRPDAHLVTGSQQGLQALLDAMPRKLGKRPDRTDEFKRMKAAKAAELDRILAPQKAYTDAIRKELPEDGIIVFDVAQLHFYSWFGWPAYRPRTVIQPGYQGTLGYAYPTALGAKVGAGKKKVVYVGGDGGFMFNCQELSTAMHFGVNVVAIVINDNAFGNVRRTQKEMFNNRVISSDLTNPDFRKFADSFGMRNYRTDSPAGLGKALRDALKADEPALIEVTIDQFPNPFPHMFFRKARG